eukprot:m.128624 g.128624  ORF g.128624 m.128624 type:complete len:390 (-) comp11243_c0_seq2:40-1209(-)
MFACAWGKLWYASEKEKRWWANRWPVKHANTSHITLRLFVTATRLAILFNLLVAHVFNQRLMCLENKVEVTNVLIVQFVIFGQPFFCGRNQLLAFLDRVGVKRCPCGVQLRVEVLNSIRHGLPHLCHTKKLLPHPIEPICFLVLDPFAKVLVLQHLRQVQLGLLWRFVSHIRVSHKVMHRQLIRIEPRLFLQHVFKVRRPVLFNRISLVQSIGDALTRYAHPTTQQWLGTGNFLLGRRLRILLIVVRLELSGRLDMLREHPRRVRRPRDRRGAAHHHPARWHPWHAWRVPAAARSGRHAVPVLHGHGWHVGWVAVHGVGSARTHCSTRSRVLHCIALMYPTAIVYHTHAWVGMHALATVHVTVPRSRPACDHHTHALLGHPAVVHHTRV